MHRVALWGDPPDGLAAALAARGLGIARDAAAGIAIRTDPPAGSRPLLILADLDEGVAIHWLDRGVDVAPPTAGAALIAARVDSLLRRATIRVGPLAIDPLARTVTRAGAAVALMPREYRLLTHLARHAGRAVGRAELLSAVWGLANDPGTNLVAVHVSRLRARLDHGHHPPLIETVKGEGYRLAG